MVILSRILGGFFGKKAAPVPPILDDPMKLTDVQKNELQQYDIRQLRQKYSFRIVDYEVNRRLTEAKGKSHEQSNPTHNPLLDKVNAYWHTVDSVAKNAANPVQSASLQTNQDAAVNPILSVALLGGLGGNKNTPVPLVEPKPSGLNHLRSLSVPLENDLERSVELACASETEKQDRAYIQFASTYLEKQLSHPTTVHLRNPILANVASAGLHIAAASAGATIGASYYIGAVAQAFDSVVTGTLQSYGALHLKAQLSAAGMFDKWAGQIHDKIAYGAVIAVGAAVAHVVAVGLYGWYTQEKARDGALKAIRPLALQALEAVALHEKQGSELVPSEKNGAFHPSTPIEHLANKVRESVYPLTNLTNTYPIVPADDVPHIRPKVEQKKRSIFDRITAACVSSASAISRYARPLVQYAGTHVL